jgi:hypothetical protein
MSRQDGLLHQSYVTPSVPAASMLLSPTAWAPEGLHLTPTPPLLEWVCCAVPAAHALVACHGNPGYHPRAWACTPAAAMNLLGAGLTTSSCGMFLAGRVVV